MTTSAMTARIRPRRRLIRRPTSIRGFSQIIEVFPDGREEVLNACMHTAGAKNYVRVFNGITRISKSRAVARAIVLPNMSYRAYWNADDGVETKKGRSR